MLLKRKKATLRQLILKLLELLVDFVGNLFISLAGLMRLGVVVIVGSGLGRDPLAAAFNALATSRLGVITTEVRLTGSAGVRSFALYVVLILGFEFLKGLVARRFNRFDLCKFLLSDHHLIRDVEQAGPLVEVHSAGPKEAILFDFRQKERVLDAVHVVLLLDFVQALGDLLASGEALFLLAHLIVNFLHIFMGALLLRLFGHSEHLAVVGPNVLHEHGTVTDLLPFERVDQGARLLVKAVTAHSLATKVITAYGDLRLRRNRPTLTGA